MASTGPIDQTTGTQLCPPYSISCIANIAVLASPKCGRSFFLLPKKAETIADVDCAERDSSSDDKAAGQHEARDH